MNKFLLRREMLAFQKEYSNKLGSQLTEAANNTKLTYNELKTIYNKIRIAINEFITLDNLLFDLERLNLIYDIYPLPKYIYFSDGLSDVELVKVQEIFNYLRERFKVVIVPIIYDDEVNYHKSWGYSFQDKIPNIIGLFN